MSRGAGQQAVGACWPFVEHLDTVEAPARATLCTSPPEWPLAAVPGARSAARIVRLRQLVRRSHQQKAKYATTVGGRRVGMAADDCRLRAKIRPPPPRPLCLDPARARRGKELKLPEAYPLAAVRRPPHQRPVGSACPPSRHLFDRVRMDTVEGTRWLTLAVTQWPDALRAPHRCAAVGAALGGKRLPMTAEPGAGAKTSILRRLVLRAMVSNDQ